MLRNKINGKIYIGQTIRSIEERFKEHQKESNGCVAIRNAIQYHGWCNFEKDLYECPDEDLNFDEELLIREMGTLSPHGYNLMEGGGACGKRSEETKQKNREAQQKYHEDNPEAGKEHGEKMKKYYKEHSEARRKLSDGKGQNKPFDVTNKQKLISIKQKYDPENIFNWKQSIPIKFN